MKFIICKYCGMEYVGIQVSNDYYNLVAYTGSYYGNLPLNQLQDVVELKTSGESGGRVSLVGLLGAKPQNVTINF